MEVRFFDKNGTLTVAVQNRESRIMVPAKKKSIFKRIIDVT